MLTDPLSVECPACGARPGENCWGLRALGRGAYVATTPHKTRIALAHGPITREQDRYITSGDTQPRPPTVMTTGRACGGSSGDERAITRVLWRAT
jgi:hypothetical protein